MHVKCDIPPNVSAGTRLDPKLGSPEHGLSGKVKRVNAKA